MDAHGGQHRQIAVLARPGSRQQVLHRDPLGDTWTHASAQIRSFNSSDDYFAIFLDIDRPPFDYASELERGAGLMNRRKRNFAKYPQGK